MNKVMNLQKCFLMIAAGILLSGCTSIVESDTWVNQAGRVQVAEDQFTDTVETSKMDDGMVRAVSDYYDRFGNGPLNVVVSYDSQSRINTRDRADMALNSIKARLVRNGVRDVNGALSVMKGSGDISTTLVSFSAVTASAPAGCGTMPGYKDPSEDIPNDTNIKAPYGYGCTIETLLAKQVVKPSDLGGRAGFETNGDGRRAERVLSGGYYSGKPNTALNGESVSDSSK